MNHYDFQKFNDLNHLQEYFYNELPENERFAFLMQFLDYPLLSGEDLVEMFYECDEVTAGNYEALVAFATKYSQSRPDEYASDYAFIEAELLPEAFYLGDQEQITRSLSVMKQNPIPGLQSVVRETLFHLLYYGNYNDAADLARCVVACADSANDVSDYDIHPFITILYLQKLEERYELWQSGADSDLTETMQEIAKLGFDITDGRLDMVFEVLKQICTQKSEDQLPHHFEDRLLTANVHFLVYMKTTYDIPFMLSDFWFNLLYRVGLFKIKLDPAAEFYISVNDLVEYFEDSTMMDNQDNRIEFSGKFWGLNYVYDFLYSKEWISATWYYKMEQNLSKISKTLASVFETELWKLNYLVSWPKPHNTGIPAAFQDAGYYRNIFEKCQELNMAKFEISKLKHDLNPLHDESESTEDITEAEPDDNRPVPIWSNPTTPYRKDQQEPGRNEPCPCGSGKKYKKCCLNSTH